MAIYKLKIDSSADLGDIAEAMYNSLHPSIDKVLRILNPGIDMTQRYRTWLGFGRRTEFSSVGTLIHEMNEYSVRVSYQPNRFPSRLLVESSLLTKKSVQKAYERLL